MRGVGGRLTLLTGRWGEPGAGRGLWEPVAAGGRRAEQGLRRGRGQAAAGPVAGEVPLRWVRVRRRLPRGLRGLSVGRPERGGARARPGGGCGASPLPGPAHAVTARGLGGGGGPAPAPASAGPRGRPHHPALRRPASGPASCRALLVVVEVVAVVVRPGGVWFCLVR